MNRIIYKFVLSSLLLIASTLVHGEEEMSSGKFVVNFFAVENAKPWIVRAVEHNVYNDMAGYGRMVPIKKEDVEGEECQADNIECFLEKYQAAGIDAFMLGLVNRDEIDYQVYDVKKGTLIKTGSVPVGRGSSLLKLRIGAFRAFKEFLEKGGILDQRSFENAEKAQAPTDELMLDTGKAGLIHFVFVGLVLFSCIPYLFSFIGYPIKHPERKGIINPYFTLFILISFLVIGLAYLLTVSDAARIYFSNFISEYYWIVMGFGGMAWGYFISLNMKFIFPYFPGIERISQHILATFLKSFFMSILVKILFLGLGYTALFYGLYFLATQEQIPSEVLYLLMMPISGIYILFWLALIIEVMAMSVDGKLSKEPLNYNHDWQKKASKYFVSYMKRNGILIKRQLNKRLVFLSQDEEGVKCYGGFFSRPRIAINKDLLELTISEFYEIPAPVTEPVAKHSLLARVTPQMPIIEEEPRKIKTLKPKKKDKLLGSLEEKFKRDLNINKSSVCERGENMMKGMILPSFHPNEDLASLMSDSLDEMMLVEALLLEDVKNRNPYTEDDEVDDSSSKDKDFLFGALLQKYGILLRYEHIFTTIAMYFKGKRPVRMRHRSFFLTKYFTVVSDTFVALNFGLNHFMQYLYFRASGSQALLTTRASSDLLLQNQGKILNKLKIKLDGTQLRVLSTSVFDRLAWLSQFCHEPVEQNPNLKFQKYTKFLLIASILGIIGVFVSNAVIYHETYLAIIEAEQKEIDEALKEAEENERKKQQ